MTAICNGVDISSLIGYGYKLELEPQYGGQVTTIDGTDYSAKLRNRVKLTVPFVAMTWEQLTEVLRLFPQNNAYVTWTYDDPYLAAERTVQMKPEPCTLELKVHHENGVEYWGGLVIQLVER